jgi:GTP-binding protein
VVAVAKSDLGEADLGELAVTAGQDVVSFSSVTGEGIDTLLHRIADAVDTAVREAPEREGFVLHRPVAAPFTIELRGDEWVVEGRMAERAVALNDLTLPEAAALAARRLNRIGLDDALREAGAEPGDDVRIGDLVFEFRDLESEPEGEGEDQ